MDQNLCDDFTRITFLFALVVSTEHKPTSGNVLESTPRKSRRVCDAKGIPPAQQKWSVRLST